MKKQIIGGSYEVSYATFRDSISIDLFGQPYYLLAQDQKGTVDEWIKNAPSK